MILFNNKRLAALLIFGLTTGVGAAIAAEPQAQPQAEPFNIMKMAERFTPELRAKLVGLSPETRKTIVGLMSERSPELRSEVATLRQVMLEIMMDYQAVAGAIAADNAEGVIAAGNRVLNHRLPVGGMLAYFPMDKLTDEGLSALPGFGVQVEGNIKKVMKAAEAGDMITAALAFGEATAGCVACHNYFRGQPGVSDRLTKPGKSTAEAKPAADHAHVH